MQFAQRDQQYRRQRHRQQHADKAEQLAERGQREDDGHRMQTDPFADQAGGDDIALQHLAGKVNARHPGYAGPVGKLQQRHQQRQNQAQPKTQKRYE